MNGKHKEKILAKNKEDSRTVWKWNIYPHIQQIFIQILIEFLLCVRCLDAWDISVNKIKDKNHILILINAENHLTKLSNHLGLKTLNKMGI